MDNSADETFRALKQIPYEQLSDAAYNYILRNNINLNETTSLAEIFLIFGWTLQEYDDEFEKRAKSELSRYNIELKI